jgi:hypothetical protein
MESSSQALKLVPSEVDYPSNYHDDSPAVPRGREPGNKFIIPVKQSFEWLRSVFAFYSFNVKMNVWGKGEMTAYMRSCSVANSVIDVVWRVNKDTANDKPTIEEPAEN